MLDSWSADRPRGNHTEETIGRLFYMKGGECSLSGVRFQKEWVEFLSVGLLHRLETPIDIEMC